MAQFLKVLAGSKLLFLPFTAVAVAGVGSFYVSYNVSRWTTAKALRVDPDHLSTTCQVSSSSVGGASVLSYLFIRHNNYSPPTFTRMMQMAVEAASSAPSQATPPTTPAGLPLTGPLQASSSRLPPTTIVSPQPVAAPSSPSRLRQVLAVIRAPARFYAVNLLVGSAVLGAGTSVGQRLLCGKMGQRREKAASMK